MNSISIAVLSDQALTREGMRSFLQSSSNVQVIGDSADVNEVLSWAARCHVDVAILDLHLPICAVHATARILAVSPATHVAVLSRHAEDPRAADVITSELRRVGASALLPKTLVAHELLEKVYSLSMGEKFFPAPDVLDGAVSPRPVGFPGLPQPSLTLRQTQVLKLVAEGLANKEIADRLSISPKTVEKHRQSVKEKLRMNNAADLARRAISLGLVQAA